jgi:uncharacterized MAPEG superfamily protein
MRPITETNPASASSLEQFGKFINFCNKIAQVFIGSQNNQVADAEVLFYLICGLIYRHYYLHGFIKWLICSMLLLVLPNITA